MSDKKPRILVLVGPNGSGKSTITQFLSGYQNKTVEMSEKSCAAFTFLL